MTSKQMLSKWQRQLDNADAKLFEWVAEYDSELGYYETETGATLKEVYSNGDYAFDISRRVEADGIAVYEFDIDAPNERKKVTRKAIARLRYLERKIAEWEAKVVMMTDAVDSWVDIDE